VSDQNPVCTGRWDGSVERPELRYTLEQVAGGRLELEHDRLEQESCNGLVDDIPLPRSLLTLEVVRSQTTHLDLRGLGVMMWNLSCSLKTMKIKFQIIELMQ